MPINFISILRFFAVLLIINSHCSAFYPKPFSEVATGGAFGNAIFFFCSGFTLYFSNKEMGFAKWMIKRLIRLYPSVWIFLLFSNLFMGKDYHLFNFIITPFWFVNAILAFYLLFYFIIKYFSKNILVIILMLLIPYLFTFFVLNDYSLFLIDWVNNSTYLHWYYYFALMLFGAYCTTKSTKVSYPIFKLFLVLFVYFSFKYLVKHSDSLFIYQVLIPFGLFPICWYILNLSKNIESFLSKNIYVSKGIGRISSLSLDAYIVQFSIIEFYQSVNIPLRLLLVFISVIIIADLLFRASGYFNKLIIKILPILK